MVKQLVFEIEAIMGLLLFKQGLQRLLDAVELLLGRQAVIAEGGDAVLHLGLQGGHPHHEELIEVVAENGAELGLLQQGRVFIQGQGQHPLVEGDPSQLPIDIELGGQNGVTHGCSA